MDLEGSNNQPFDRIMTDLNQDIRSTILDAIYKEMMSDFEKRAKPLIKDYVDKLSVGKIMAAYDLARFQDTVEIQLKWSEQKMGKHELASLDCIPVLLSPLIGAGQEGLTKSQINKILADWDEARAKVAGDFVP